MSNVLDINKQLEEKKLKDKRTKKLVDYLRNGGKLTMAVKDENGNIKKYKMSLKNGEVP